MDIKQLALPQSVLDTDLYKLTMLQFIWKQEMLDAKTEFRFIERNRDETPENERISKETYRTAYEILTEWAEDFRFTYKDIDYLSTITDEDGSPVFKKEFLYYLRKIFIMSELKWTDEAPFIYTEGSWAETTLWEIYVLSTVNALHNYNRSPELFKRRMIDCIDPVFGKMLAVMDSNTEPIISDFGTRRRYSYDVHEFVLGRGVEHNIIKSTSNLHLARELNIKPVGTFAHEIPMGMVALKADQLTASNVTKNYNGIYKPVFDKWKKSFGTGFNIALTDTYGSKAVFDNDLIDLSWDGVRHDSGCPCEFTELVLDWLKRKQDEGQKLIKPFRIVYSDGLTFDLIIRLEKEFSHQKDIKLMYGIGTNLTNDVNQKPTSIVMKLTKINGNDTVKISDNLAKSVSYGDSQMLNIYKSAFGHTHNFSQKLNV